MTQLQITCLKLMAQGWKIGVITHLPMNATRDYEEKCAEEKRVWCKKYMPYIQEFYPQQYGLDKYQAPRYKNDVMILVDDNKEVCKMWESHNMKTIDPTTGDLIKKLESLLK